MNFTMIELRDVVFDLNAEFYDNGADDPPPFLLETTGTYTRITFIGKTVWDTEDNSVQTEAEGVPQMTLKEWATLQARSILDSLEYLKE